MKTFGDRLREMDLVTAEWKPTYGRFKCSRCGKTSTEKLKECPDCRAVMKED